MRDFEAMRKLSQDILKVVNEVDEENESLAKKAYRAAQVRAMWSECVGEIFLDHTNSIYIVREEERKTLIVYVDESIFAAELNAQRELIKLKFLQKFGEDIDEFKILISRGNYKKNFPFKLDQNQNLKNKTTPIPLSVNEKSRVAEITASIEDTKVRESLERAIVADLEWKKGILKQENENN